MAIAFLTASAQSNSYIVKTKGVKKSAQTHMQDELAEAQQDEEEASQDFISQNFKYHSLCDWEKGMKFMVMPEKYDLVVKTFTDASTEKEVSSMTLKYKIMVYQGHDESKDGHARINFICQDNGKPYYYEIGYGTFDDYCFQKTGVPTLAYLGDVDIAKEKLMDKTLFTKTKHYRIDTEYDGEGYQDVEVDADMDIRVKKSGMPRDLRYMSKGQRDLAGVCMRMALISAMYKGEKPFVVLDDPFMGFDDEKVSRVRRFLYEIAKDYQVIYFTCSDSRT